MNVMLIFDVVIIALGVYMILQALGMKKKGEISSAIVTPEEIMKCKDKNGFVQYIYGKEVVFGIVIILAGILGIVNEQIFSLGVLNYVSGGMFLVFFFWFQRSLRIAREKFFY